MNEVSVSAIPSNSARRGGESSECWIHLIRGGPEKQRFITIRVSGEGSEVAVGPIRQWLEALLCSGGVTEAELPLLDLRVQVARGIVVPIFQTPLDPKKV